MRVLFLLFAILCGISMNAAPVILSFPVVSTLPVDKVNHLHEASLSGMDISKMSVRQYEKKSGIKLRFTEKLGFKVMQQQFRKGPEPGSRGRTALIFGIIGATSLLAPFTVLLSIPASILAIVFGDMALKENPEDKNAKTAKILGWVTLGVIVFAVILIFAIFTGGFGIW